MTDRRLCLALLLATSALTACEDKPKEVKASTGDAGASQVAAVDPNLAEAVAAAGAKKGPDQGPAADPNGPPESGVFAPGKADEQLPKGKPPKIALGGAGAEPRVTLKASVEPGWKENGHLELSLKLGRAALPALDVAIALEAPKAKPAAGADAPADDGSVPMVAKISDVKPKEDLGAQGKQLAAQLASIRGSRIDFRIAPGGVGVDFKYKLAAGAQQELDMIVRSISEALETVTVGFPSEPVGKGGYWLVTTRDNTGGADVVAYRLVKLEGIEGDELTLSVNTKRYSASNKLALVGLPPGAELEQFQSTTDGKLTVHKGTPIASSGSTKQSFLAQLIPAGQSDQRLGVQSVAEVTATFGKK